MDLSQIVISQRLPQNQFVFDADAFDQAVLRAEKRREHFKSIWNKCHLGFNKTPFSQHLLSKLASRRKIG